MNKTILSLFDYTGNWSKPYRDNGYNVIQVDIKNEVDILTWNYKNIQSVYGILVAIPCTDYAVSGARWFKDKDIDGRTEKSQLLVAKTKTKDGKSPGYHTELCKELRQITPQGFAKAFYESNK